MALLLDEISSFSRFQQLEHRPMMLKDFLRDDSSHSCSSSSSNGFPMYPRKKPCKSTVAVSSNSNKRPILLLRGLSKKAAATKISAIHKVINVVKLLQFASLKSPSVLPRSFSRRLTKRGKGKNDILGDVSEVKVKVKDIIRWRSFRDVMEDYSTPLDFPSSPNRISITATAVTTATTATNSSSCSKRSSWCDSDFTAEELPPWGGENQEFWGKNAATLRNSKVDWSIEECEQQSPVSVLESPFRQVREFISPFHPTVANIQKAKCNLTRRFQELDFEGEIDIFEEANETEEKAKQLLSHVKEDSEIHVMNDDVLLDFFLHELSINGNLHDDEFDGKILGITKSWIDGEFDESYEWEVEEKRESYVKDMERGICWNKFEQEQEELTRELEITVLNELIDDLSADLISC